jgi:hypothetical protein
MEETHLPMNKKLVHEILKNARYHVNRADSIVFFLLQVAVTTVFIDYTDCMHVSSMNP